MRYDIRSWSELEKYAREIGEQDRVVLLVGDKPIRARVENCTEKGDRDDV